jgi:riboflavin kinase/FMN adenylyltransferase
MDLIRVTGRTRGRRGGCVVAVGNFDGVHLGHQALVARVRELALERGLASAVLTFEPTPLEFLAPARAPARLMRLRDKSAALAALGIARLYVLRFGTRVQNLTPAGFEDLLAEALGAQHVVVGEGFRYAKERQGSLASLVAGGARRGFAVEVVGSVLARGARVSSTRIREALASGDLELARALLGRDYRICGRVVRGARLGRALGFATANVRLARRRVPLWGIYAARALIGDELRPAVASLGTRPTIASSDAEPLLETHVFDFDGDLYGRRIAVDFVEKLRDEARFADLDALVAQMHDDARRARAILACDAA